MEKQLNLLELEIKKKCDHFEEIMAKNHLVFETLKQIK